MARVSRTKEERVAIIDEKIAKKKAEIATLEEKKHRIEHPVSVRSVVSAAKEAGLTPEEIAEKLGIEIE